MSGRGPLEAGRIFARDFKVARLLARGGMGEVWVVEQLSTGKLRALKTMSSALVESARGRERFAQEARVGSRIGSEHVVEVIAAGIDEETDTPWLAMELLDGEDLAAMVAQRGLLPRDEVREISSQLREALAAAHAQGIVHRDLKPENVFIDRTKRRGVPFLVKVLDFGIASIVQEGKRAATVTSAIGSPLFMAPEQAQRGARVSPATDVWALALIEFWLLTGRSYWVGANVDEEDFNLSALLIEVMTQPIVAASERARELGVAEPLPAGFDTWFAACMEREPERRTPDAGAALDGILRLLEPADESSAAAGGLAVAPTVALAEPPAERPAIAPTVAMADASPSEASAPLTAPTQALSASGPAGSVAPTVALSAEASAAAGLPATVALDAASVAPPESAPRGGAIIPVVVASIALLSVGAWAFVRFGQPAADASATGADAGAVEAGELALGDAAPSAPPEEIPAVDPRPALFPTCAADAVLHPATVFDLTTDDGTDDYVSLSPYCLDRTEVTVAAYRACVEAEVCSDRHRVWFPGISSGDRAGYGRFCNAARHLDTHPINCVTWEQADVYCRWTGGRLPTEAEWEYAAARDRRRAFPWGEEPVDGTRANLCDRDCRAMFRRAGASGVDAVPWSDGFDTTAPVGSFPRGATPGGVQDLMGNVREWLADWDGPSGAPGTLASPRVDPRGPSTGTERVARGAAWNSYLEETAVGYRWTFDPQMTTSMDGFRCVYAPTLRP